MNMRPFSPDDKPACMDIFRSNQPKFFTEAETKEFSDFLDNLPCPYFVLQTEAGDSAKDHPIPDYT